MPTCAEIDALAGCPEDLNRQLLLLSRAASEGSEAAIDVVLYAIDSQRLAEPGIRRVLLEPDDVDEVAQDVLLTVATRIGSFRNEGRFTSWLFGVARYKALEFLRRKHEMSEFRVELGDSERISSLISNEVTVKALLSGLPEHYRVAVTMRDIDGMAYADIAKALELNLNTVRAHIARGRALLVATVADES